MATRSRLKGVGIAAGILGVGAFVWFVAQSLSGSSGPVRKHTVHQLSLVKPPPPPPPPPKQEQLPEVKKEEVKIETPQPPPETPQQADAPPPGANLGLDADGSAGTDGFGLQANKGGRDLLTLGGPAGSESGRHTAFAGRLQRFLQSELARNTALREGEYRAEIRVWLGNDGAIARVEIAQASGNSRIDEQLRIALNALPGMGERPPETMPQPVRLRITSRASG